MGLGGMSSKSNTLKKGTTTTASTIGFGNKLEPPSSKVKISNKPPLNFKIDSSVNSNLGN